jgi:hypothetical protein
MRCEGRKKSLAARLRSDTLDRPPRKTMPMERLDEGLNRGIAVAGDHAVLGTYLGKRRRLHH